MDISITDIYRDISTYIKRLSQKAENGDISRD